MSLGRRLNIENSCERFFTVSILSNALWSLDRQKLRNVVVGDGGAASCHKRRVISMSLPLTLFRTVHSGLVAVRTLHG